MAEKLTACRPEELAEEHWAYVEALLINHGVVGIAEIEFHYKTAFLHGYKHGSAESPWHLTSAGQVNPVDNEK